METKAELRRIFKDKRKQLTPEERENFSLALAHQVLEYVDKSMVTKHIHIFLPIRKFNEVNTFPLIEMLLDRGVDLYTSTTDFRSQEMMTIKLKAPLAIYEDEFGIPVPVSQEEADFNALDMVLIPLLAYDLEGNRLGYGMGFYDKFLFSLSTDVVKAGLSFFPPEMSLPSEAHDVKLDICFTAKQVYKF